KEAIPKIIKLAKNMEEEDRVSAIIISCAADPGINEVRDVVSIPVVGAGECGALVAKSISNKIGVLKITDEIPDSMKSILHNDTPSVKPQNVQNVNDLYNPDHLNNSIAAVNQLLNQGVEVILFA